MPSVSRMFLKAKSVCVRVQKCRLFMKMMYAFVHCVEGLLFYYFTALPFVYSLGSVAAEMYSVFNIGSFCAREFRNIILGEAR